MAGPIDPGCGASPTAQASELLRDGRVSNADMCALTDRLAVELAKQAGIGSMLSR